MTGTFQMDDLESRPRLPAGVRQLFADGGAGRTLPVTLPEGALVWPDPGYRPLSAARRPACWLSDEPALPGLWERLRAEHTGSGLWPLLLDDSTQPWSAGQLAPEPVAHIGDYDPGAFMAEVWADWAEQQDGDFDDLEPFGELCPGPAPPGEPLADPGKMADRLARELYGRGTHLGLVAADRGADALAVMGWQGALHHNEWVAPLAAVVRGWEDRFGARVVGLGFNTLDLSVAAPPITARHALHVAAEHWAFCPDTMFQGPETLEEYADEIRGRASWSFWWD